MDLRLLIIVATFHSSLSCFDHLCADCISLSRNKTVYQQCLKCNTNYVLNEQGQCTPNLAILVSLSVTAFVCISASLIVRHLLILRSLRKKQVYTAEYQQNLLKFLQSNNAHQASNHAQIPYTSRGLHTIQQQPEQQERIQKCDKCIKLEPSQDKIDAFLKCKHAFHCRCLRTHLQNQFEVNPHQIAGLCPACDQRLDYLSLYCQYCSQRSREIQIEQKYSLYGLNSFVCFRCRRRQIGERREEQRKMCCGLGRYLCCHCIPY